MKNWNRLSKKIQSSPRAEPVAKPYFDQTIQHIFDVGANLATPEMEALAPAKMLWDHFASGGEDEPLPEGIVRFCNHERSGAIAGFIDGALAPWIKKNGEVWLLPVFDDEEYVAWDFFFVVGTKTEVLEKLRTLREVRR